MLKFQNNNTITIATFEDFILTAFVIMMLGSKAPYSTLKSSYVL